MCLSRDNEVAVITNRSGAGAVEAANKRRVVAPALVQLHVDGPGAVARQRVGNRRQGGDDVHVVCVCAVLLFVGKLRVVHLHGKEANGPVWVAHSLCAVHVGISKLHIRPVFWQMNVHFVCGRKHPIVLWHIRYLACSELNVNVSVWGGDGVCA